MLDFLRRFKLSYMLYNLFKKNQLRHNLPLYRRYGLKKWYFSPISSRDFAHLPPETNPMDQLDSGEVFPRDPAFQQLPAHRQAELLPWSEKGYAILKGFFSADEVAAINAEVDRLIANRQAKWGVGNRIMFAIHQSDLLRRTATQPQLMQVLKLLMGKEVELFQSINFIEASQQKTHSDSIHMATYPYGNLIAAWIALEEVDATNGPLHYYPGSHRLPYLMNADFGNEGTAWMLGNKPYKEYERKVAEVVAAHGLEKEVFLAGPGDVFIWHANLLHGGEPLADPRRTRKSMVMHYYGADAVCFHELTQRPSLKVLHTSIRQGS